MAGAAVEGIDDFFINEAQVDVVIEAKQCVRSIES